MADRTELIILGLTKVRDSAAVIHTLTPEWGRRSFIISTGKGRHMSMFLPLSIVEAEIVENRKAKGSE